jgi:hypothetical protein
MFVDLPSDVFESLVKEWIELKHVLKLNSAVSSDRNIFNKSIHIESKVLQNVHSGLLHVEICVGFPQLGHTYTFVPISLSSLKERTIEMLSHQRGILFHLAKYSSPNSVDYVESCCQGDWRSGFVQSCSTYINNRSQKGNDFAAKWICSLKEPHLTSFDQYTRSCSCIGYAHETTTCFSNRCSCHIFRRGTFKQPTVYQLMGLLKANYPEQFDREFVAQFVTPRDARASGSMKCGDYFFVLVTFYLPSAIPASTSFPEFSHFLHTDKSGKQYYQTVMRVGQIHLSALQTTMVDGTGFRSSRTLHVSIFPRKIRINHMSLLNSTRMRRGNILDVKEQ